MTSVRVERFSEFFEALHGDAPYAWQERLAEQAVADDWPGVIDLPTGSGKTACIDVAVFALACQADADVHQGVAPRRIFFCVNRRVIVDDAFNRARRIATAIWDAEKNGKGVLRDVAAALRRIAGSQQDGDTPPLDVLELRGGIYRDNRWARSITQPTVVCTTIDQLGSRLLFRGYGISANAAPIQAALIAYDSLILLDEAHISQPFHQTLEFVRRYLQPDKWAKHDIGVHPATVVPMTATPPDGVSEDNTVRLTDADRDNESLKRRLTASKNAELREVIDVVKGAVDASLALAGTKPAAVGIMVNRVAKARAIYDALSAAHNEPNDKKRKVPADAVVELVIGSMRPIDRDKQADRLRSLLGRDRPAVTERTSFVVATQCLEVGADYDFDVLVTECASLDALRQRFGRLNRAGKRPQGNPMDANAVIVIDKKAVKSEGDIETVEQSKDANKRSLDPIYGNALARTWNWLNEHATDQTKGQAVVKAIDFGIDALGTLLERHGKEGHIPRRLLAPSASLNAPVMLPAYVDMWAQTAPRPVLDPDLSLFLHGPQRGDPDVQLCWRADLIVDDLMARDKWCAVVELLPPTSTECMSVPISRVRGWLDGQTEQASDYGDLQGVSAPDESDAKGSESRRQRSSRYGVLWRGAKDTKLIDSHNDLRPGDTLVLPVSAGGWDELGHIPESCPASTHEAPTGDRSTAADDVPTSTRPAKSAVALTPEDANRDIAELAFHTARDHATLRVHLSMRKRFPADAAIQRLFDRAADDENPPTAGEWRNLLHAAADGLGQDHPLADQMRKLAVKKYGLRFQRYPDGRGFVLTTRRRIGTASDWFLPPLDDGDDQPSHTCREKPILLDDHAAHVVDALKKPLQRLPLERLTNAFEQAAFLHDLGKADERFQAVLRCTNRTDAWLLTGLTSTVLAKSDGLPTTRRERNAARLRAELPDGFRHEMLSVQLVECSGDLPEALPERDLVLHLIAAHHGHARPFAPVVNDEELPAVEVGAHQLSHEQRKQLVPPHRLDSGIPERFWSLTRRFGWWGLAYLEAVLRLADQQASAAEDAGEYENAETNQPAEAVG